MPLLSGDQVSLQYFLSQDIPAQLVRVGPLLCFWNQHTAFLSSDLPIKPQSSSCITASGLEPAGLFGPGTVTGRCLQQWDPERPREESSFFQFQPPASKVASEKAIVEED